MTVKNKDISLTQLCVILLGIFISMRPIFENAIQAKYVENDCIITCIVAGLINLCLALLVCYVIKKNPGKSFFDIIKNLIGESVAKLIMFLLGIVFVFKLLIIDYQLEFLLYDAIYSEIDWILFTIPVLLVIAFIAVKGIKTIARCYQIFLPFAISVLVVILFLSFMNANFENILPLFDHPLPAFMQSLNNLLIQSSEFIFLFTFMENVVSKDKHYFLKIITTLLLTFLLVVIFYVLFIAVLGKIAPFAQESLIKMTQFKDNTYGYFKVDAFAAMFWLPIIILQNVFCVYSISYCLNKSLNFRKDISCVLVTIMLFVIKLIPQINNQTVSELFFDKIGIFVISFLLFLPILLLLSSFKKEKTK